MNIWLLFLFIFCVFLRYGGIGLGFIPYLRAFFATIMPPKVAQAKLLRGDVVEIPYQYDGRSFVLRCNIGRQMWSSVIANTDEGRIDVTDDVRTFAGPFGDFLGVQITPQDMNDTWNSLIFKAGRRSKKVFQREQPIVFD